MTDVLPLDKYPHIQFGESGTRSVSQESGTPGLSQKSGTPGLSQKSGTSRKSHKCLMCPTQITGRAKTCSENCRRASNRRTEQITNTAMTITSQLKQLQRYADQWPDLWPEIMSAVNQSCVQAGVTSRYVAPKGDSFPSR